MTKTNILLTQKLPDRLTKKIERVSKEISLQYYDPKEEAENLPELLEEIDVIYTYSFLPRPEDAPKLRWVQLTSAGVDHIINHPLYTDADVAFTTTSGIHAIQIAEYTLMQMLALAHHLPRMIEDQYNSTWTKGRWDRFVPQELHGATLGVLGYGSIGRQIARLAQGFGMHILALKRNARQPEHSSYAIPHIGDPAGSIPDRIYPAEALHSFLKECDFVVVTTPLNEHTRNLIDAECFSAMKDEAYLINVARGGVIDEAALVTALEEGQIAGAALDVFEQEPLPEDSPLWQLSNVILSPHVSGFTPHYDDRATDVFVANLNRFLAKDTLINLVDRARDY